MRAEILRAIDHRNLLSFSFRGTLYTVEPHAYGETANGVEVLRCFQVGGDSHLSEFGWNLIPVAEVAGFDEIDPRFNPRDGFAPGDLGMSKIYAQLQVEPERSEAEREGWNPGDVRPVVSGVQWIDYWTKNLQAGCATFTVGDKLGENVLCWRYRESLPACFTSPREGT